jgi:type II secretory pathway predicted ATPase ExeA
MTTSFFSPLGLDNDSPDDPFFPSEQSKAALNRLKPILELGGIAVVVGDPGVGKSRLLEHLEQQVDKTHYRCVRIDFTNLNPSSFLRQLVLVFEEKPRRSKSDVVHQICSLWCCVPQRILLVVDESQCLGASLEDLRLLLTTVGQKKAVTVILAGQPGLREMLRSPLQQALAQRITVRCRLLGWSLTEACSYLSQRLKRMGAHPHFMDVETMEALHDYAKGNPRIIVQTFTSCLISMVVEGQSKLDLACFKRTLAGLEV